MLRVVDEPGHVGAQYESCCPLSETLQILMSVLNILVRAEYEHKHIIETVFEVECAPNIYPPQFLWGVEGERSFFGPASKVSFCRSFRLVQRPDPVALFF